MLPSISRLGPDTQIHLQSNFFEFETFLESNFPDILALCETNLDDLTDSGNFSVSGNLPFRLSSFYSYA